MPNNRRGLGRGLDALIPTELENTSGLQATSAERVDQADPSNIKPNPHQPRQQFDESELADLAASIKVHGIVQPLVVSRDGSGFELIAGERRLRAAKKLGLKSVPIIVRSLDEQAKLELALIENVQRADLNAIESALAYRKLVDQFNLKLEDVSRRVGKSVPTISNTMRLLGLPRPAIDAIMAGLISEGHGRAILAVKDPANREAMLKVILDRKLTVREAEHLSRGFKLPAEDKQDAAIKHLSTTNQWTQALSSRLRTDVAINRRAQGGRLVISFNDDKDLERISQQLLSD